MNETGRSILLYSSIVGFSIFFWATGFIAGGLEGESECAVFKDPVHLNSSYCVLGCLRSLCVGLFCQKEMFNKIYTINDTISCCWDGYGCDVVCDGVIH